VIGISTDDHQTQCDFAEKMRVQFPMIGDKDGTISRSYDVLWPYIKRVRRVTFLIDAEGMIQGIYQHEFLISHHRDDVFAGLKWLKRQATRSA
jgi:peroxiredoxin